MIPRNRPVWLIPVIAAVLSLAGVFSVLVIRDGMDRQAPREAGRVVTSGEAQIGGSFTLTDETGASVTDADFAGRPMLVYFGFTYCPDICPFTLQVLAQALDLMAPEAAAQFQPLLISVDPERDTPEALAQYVRSPAFPANLRALTGTPEQIRGVADAYKVYYARVDDAGSSAGYTMDHTSVVYLMGRQGEFIDVFAHGATPELIASSLQRFLEENPA